MSEKQNELLHQFKSNVQDILTPLHTDDVLFKYLKARNFDLEDAEENFRIVDGTSKLYGINTILEHYEPTEVFQKYATNTFLGFAKDGSAVCYISCKIDFVGFILSATTYDTYRYFCYTIESDLQRMRDEHLKGKPYCNEVTYIIDMDGFSLSDVYHKCVIENGLDHFHHFQDYYPEVWRHIFIVNVSGMYDAFFALFKPIFKASLLEKFQLATKKGTGDLLRKYIDDDVLPAFLGGTRVDSTGDPRCREFMRFGGKIPEKYHLRNCTHLIEPPDPGVKVAVVRARSVLNVPVVVKSSRSLVKLEFRGENGSVFITVYYRELGPDPENPELPSPDEILDPRAEGSNVVQESLRLRCQIHLAPNGGHGVITKPGIYIVQFDNRSSWFGSRKIYYRITTLTPAE